MKKVLVFLLVLLANAPLYAQANYRTGLLPSLNVNQKISKDWRLNYKAEVRLLGAEGRFSEPLDFDARYGLTDFSVIASRTAGLNNTLAAGYLLRLEKGAISHRTIQQYTAVTRYSSFRWANRFAADQTFTPDESVQLRLRYRIGFELPLNGQSVDNREFYIKFNNEYLNEWQNQNYDLEIRVVPFLGFAINDNNKVEWGVDYRLSGFLGEVPRSTFWLPVNWFIRI